MCAQQTEVEGGGEGESEDGPGRTHNKFHDELVNHHRRDEDSVLLPLVKGRRKKERIRVMMTGE